MTDTSTETPDKTPRHRSGLAAAAREFVLIVVGALIVSSILRAFVGQMFIIPSESMQNTLLVGDRVVVEKITDVERGDVVVFEDPGGWLGTEESGQKRGSVGRFFEVVGLLPDSSHGHLIKRLVGMPGDKVACCDAQGRLLVNGQPLEESSYLFPGDAPSAMEFQVTVPAGHVFVMGDHRSESGDSRVHLSDAGSEGSTPGDAAFVPLDKVTGRAVLVVWPASNFGKLGVPDTFKSVPPAVEPPPAKPSISLTAPPK
ncbi:signal peptidase I [Kribbella flavida DSM 17836]|uniref:Signal peptidase I n=1 Tax=Kribbella flavida (strain DSM 17836 / JCM 10339 / NBRC 14399) TaxID=479435 RepID=D2PZG4_KRIFD|nr:signal peptidase I [Kribbella flavida]ADB33773.1 signal peptidase I [Kribbella flavida DSM 17836]